MKTLLTFVILLLAGVTVGRAAWIPDGVALTTASRDQWMCQIVSDGDGGAIVAWNDYRNPDHLDVYAQRVDASGTVLWLADGVPICTADGTQAGIRLISDGAGGAIITWWDRRGAAVQADIYAQRVDDSGNIQWATNGRMICRASDDQQDPDIISDGDGGAIIVWHDYRSGADIYAQHVDASGTVHWGAGGVPVCDHTAWQLFSQIATDRSGGVIVTWQDHRSVPGTDIYAQRLNASGVRQWTVDGVVICDRPGWDDCEMPNITSDGAGGAIITWIDRRDGYSRVYAQHVDDSGVVGWAEDGVVMRTAEGTQSDHQIVTDGDGGAIVSWRDYLDGRGTDVFAQRVDPSGVVQWTVDGAVVCEAESHQEQPVMAADGAGGAIVSWSDFRNDGQYDIYAQRLDASGNTLWTEGGVAVCLAPGGQGEQQVVSDLTGGAIVAWKDPRSGNMDVYALSVNEHGGTVPTLISGYHTQWIEHAVEVSWTMSGTPGPIDVQVSRKAGSVTYDRLKGYELVQSDKEYSIRDATAKPGNSYWYLVEMYDGHELVASFETSINTPVYPFALLQNHPNPFNPSTEIGFTLDRDSYVSLAVYDLSGRLVRTLVDGHRTAGAHSETWNGLDSNGRRTASGVYFYRIVTDHGTLTKRMVFLK